MIIYKTLNQKINIKKEKKIMESKFKRSRIDQLTNTILAIEDAENQADFLTALPSEIRFVIMKHLWRVDPHHRLKWIMRLCRVNHEFKEFCDYFG